METFISRIFAQLTAADNFAKSSENQIKSHVEKASVMQSAAQKESDRLELLENAAEIAEEKLRKQKERERLQQMVFEFAIGWQSYNLKLNFKN